MIVRFTCFAAAMLAMSTAAVSIGGGDPMIIMDKMSKCM